ncbi:hypothetical protein [Tychonema sp. LEGE 06208]|uniref:hypothetical protein n=1 Tax=Tychonema sp. LEGE 06208 TaxID=1828663 RepID=UPI00187EEE74|nr:hypothetical protein [Tychonema sp. LEGE 06208]MBE9160907.1 hypothetical protein [Tychonema sp. LEGE 06208]
MTPSSEFDEQQSASQADLPQPNEEGEYTRTSHQYWEVVDSDPNGLNCRMGSHSIREIEDPGSKIDLNIGSWPVVGTLKQGQNFEIYLGPSGLGVLYDDRHQPWFFVAKSEGVGGPSNCFVRARSSFVKPIQPE